MKQLTTKQKTTLRKWLSMHEVYQKDKYFNSSEGLREVLDVAQDFYGKKIDRTCPVCIFSNFEKIYFEYQKQPNAKKAKKV